MQCNNRPTLQPLSSICFTFFRYLWGLFGTASAFNLAYREASGELQYFEGYPRPWSLMLTGFKNRQYLELRVKPASDDGSAVCVIAIDGEEVAINEVKGWPEEAICIYRLP